MSKSKYWVGVCYPENMSSTWQSDISDTVQVPFAYCIHDKDLLKDGDESRKVHVHIVLVFPNTTTQRHALSVFNLLSASGRVCCPMCQPIINIRSKYDYLIHDTEECRKKEKYLYSPSERITGNNFDIGSYEQLSIEEKNDMAMELCNVIVQNNFTNFADFYMFVISNFDRQYFEIIKSYSGLYDRLIKGVWLRSQ